MLFGRQRSHTIHLRRPSPFRRSFPFRPIDTLTLLAIFVELAIEIYKGRSAFRGEWTGLSWQIPKRRMGLCWLIAQSTIDESPYMSMKDMGWAPVKSLGATKRMSVCDLHVPGTLLSDERPCRPTAAPSSRMQI